MMKHTLLITSSSFIGRDARAFMYINVNRHLLYLLGALGPPSLQKATARRYIFKAKWWRAE